LRGDWKRCGKRGNFGEGRGLEKGRSYPGIK